MRDGRGVPTAAAAEEAIEIADTLEELADRARSHVLAEDVVAIYLEYDLDGRAYLRIVAREKGAGAR